MAVLRQRAAVSRDGTAKAGHVPAAGPGEPGPPPNRSRPRTVIVELDLPMPKLEAAAPLRPDLRGKPRFRFAAPDASAAEAGRKIEASKEDIASITGRLPETYLSAAGSFVVTANGEQIGRIARMSSVSATWPNAQRGR